MPTPPLRAAQYLISIPERVLRSATAVAGGLVQELTDVVVPDFLRRTNVYRNLIADTLRFLIENVGEVEHAADPADTVTNKFLLRRTAGDGIDFLSLLTLKASPVWILAALADLSGAGKQLLQEIAATLQAEGLLESGTSIATMEQLLHGLEETAARSARTLRMPPLDIDELRRQWASIREAAATLPSARLPDPELLRSQWKAVVDEAAAQKRSVLEMSLLIALSTLRSMPDQLLWFGQSAVIAASTTGRMVADALLDHYTRTLGDIHRIGYLKYWAREFQPYLKAAALQFSPDRFSLTERLLFRNRS